MVRVVVGFGIAGEGRMGKRKEGFAGVESGGGNQRQAQAGGSGETAESGSCIHGH